MSKDVSYSLLRWGGQQLKHPPDGTEGYIGQLYFSSAAHVLEYGNKEYKYIRFKSPLLLSPHLHPNPNYVIPLLKVKTRLNVIVVFGVQNRELPGVQLQKCQGLNEPITD